MWQSSEGSNAGGSARTDLPRNVDELMERIVAEPILSAAVASMGLAFGLELAGKSKAARFVGLWAPTLLLIGLYRQGMARNVSNPAQRATDDRNSQHQFQGGCAARPNDEASAETIDTGFRFPHKAK